jgi:hypothetical protein
VLCNEAGLQYGRWGHDAEMVQRPEMPDYAVLLQRGYGFTTSGGECKLQPSVQNAIYAEREWEGLDGRRGFPLRFPPRTRLWPLFEIAICSTDYTPMPLVLALLRLLERLPTNENYLEWDSSVNTFLVEYGGRAAQSQTF